LPEKKPRLSVHLGSFDPVARLRDSARRRFHHAHPLAPSAGPASPFPAFGLAWRSLVPERFRGGCAFGPVLETLDPSTVSPAKESGAIATHQKCPR